jgi:RNA polymerase sigma-70 factor (family 1)
LKQPTNISAKSLLKEVAGGNEAAFRTLFDTWRDKLYSFCYGLCASPDHAADVVQETFIRIWRSRQMLASVDNFQAYLFKVARHYIIDQMRKLARESAVFAELDGVPASTPEEEFSRKELRELLAQIIQQLPERQQQIYRMHREEGLSHDEIARRLGLSVSTVQNHMFRALENIRVKLTAHFPDIQSNFPIFMLGILLLKKN